MNKIIYINIEFPNQPKESDYGNKEYKWKILPDKPELMDFKCNKLASQMIYRIFEGDGKATYIIGILDSGIPIGLSELEVLKTINMFKRITNIIKCNITSIRVYNTDKNFIITMRISKNIYV